MGRCRFTLSAGGGGSPVDAELRVEIDDRSGSVGEEPYLGYEMRAMRFKENNENNKQHNDECERPMNDIKGG